MRASTSLPLLGLPLLGLLAIAGCEGCGHDGPSGAAAATGEGTGSGGEGEADTPDPGDRGPAPMLVVRIEHDGADGFPFVVENHGDSAVSLRPAVIIERREGDTWRAVDEIQSVSLRMDCDGAAPERVPLAPGAALHPPAWSGMIGDAQCACERCVRAPAGDYRAVVTTENGAHRTESNVVALAAR